MVPSRWRWSSALGRRRMKSWMFISIRSTRRRELGAVAAIEEVDQQADEEPDEERGPCQDFEAHHEYDAEDDAEHGEDRTERGAKGAMAVGLAVAQDEHGDGDEYEGKQGADVGEIRDSSNVEEAGRHAHHEPRDPGGNGRRAIARVNLPEDLGEKAIA